jgi:hypothetical protein
MSAFARIAVVTLLGLLAADAVNVSGQWQFQVKAPVGSGEAAFTLRQDAEKITGHYSGPLGDADVSGSITGQKIVLSVTHEKSGKRMQETFAGTIENANSITGTLTQQYMGDGTFTAKRQSGK